MAVITIDGKKHEVDEKQNLLHICLSLGYNLPYFCWHPAMGSVGACRQCAVIKYKDEKDDKGKLVMACMEPASDGAIISLKNPEAEGFRTEIIEWLMTNHPHDCPVCDEGGECHLQDMTVMTGHDYRRFRFKKRTYRNQYLGPFVNHEMNRCIQCYRCVRFYRDYADGRDLDDAARAVAGIISAHITPSMMEFLDKTTINCVEDYAHIGLPVNSEAVLLIEVDGRGSSVQEDANSIHQILNKNNCSYLKSARDRVEAEALKTARRAAFSALARKKPTTILEDTTVPRSELPVMIEKVNEAARKFDVVFGNFGHAGDGNIHPTCLTDERDKNEISKAHRAFEFIFNEAIKLGGTITGEHGTGLAKKQFLESVAGLPGLEMMKKIKASIDEKNILNPGKIFSLKPKCEVLFPDGKKNV